MGPKKALKLRGKIRFRASVSALTSIGAPRSGHQPKLAATAKADGATHQNPTGMAAFARNAERQVGLFVLKKLHVIHLHLLGENGRAVGVFVEIAANG